MLSLKTHYDVAIVGGGHNALVAASYLGKAGLSVLVLEKQDQVGGASISSKIFDGIDASPSRYAYLVSLFPEGIVSDLGLRFETHWRAIASYTPKGEQALLVSNADKESTRRSFIKLTGETEYENYKRFLALESTFAKKVWPTMLEAMPSKEGLRKLFVTEKEKEAWSMFVEHPLGEAIEKYFSHDLVRGLVFTDAKIGMLTYPEDPTLLQNRTFLYHVIGNMTGEWRVPIGGMGALVSELMRVAREGGADIRTSSEVTALNPEKDFVEVEYVDRKNGVLEKTSCTFLLCGAAPAVLERLLKKEPVTRTTGSVFKINMLLERLPKIKSAVYSPQEAFAGTFHVHEGYEEMRTSAQDALQNRLPSVFAGEMYCHTLTDGSILSPELCKRGYQTLTFFGLDMPYSLFAQDNKKTTETVLANYLDSINSELAEPIQDCLAKDVHGTLCIEAKSPLDLEAELAMPEGNIFHGNLSWFFDDEDAGQWGVETEYKNIFICGAGAKRGG